MAPHSSTLAWKIPWTEEPGRLQSMGSLRVGHDWATSLSLFTFIHWRRNTGCHSSVLAWRIPGMAEPGRLPSMGSHRVGHDWNDLAAAAAAYNHRYNLYNWWMLMLPSIWGSLLLKVIIYTSFEHRRKSFPRTGKGQFSFQFKRKAMPKNVQTTAQLYSSCTLPE